MTCLLVCAQGVFDVLSTMNLFPLFRLQRCRDAELAMLPPCSPMLDSETCSLRSPFWRRIASFVLLKRGSTTARVSSRKCESTAPPTDCFGTALDGFVRVSGMLLRDDQEDLSLPKLCVYQSLGPCISRQISFPRTGNSETNKARISG